MSRRNVAPRTQRANRKRARHRFSGILSRNPVLVSGMLLAPAVVASTSLKNAVALSITLVIVTLPTMVLASVLKETLPKWLRYPLYTLVASLLLFPAGAIVAPIAPTIFDSMGMYFGLMVFNSILQTRGEKFALKNSPLATLLDGTCYCTGFALTMLIISALRELLYANTLWGIPVALPFKISAVVLPFAGFMLLGMLAAVGRYLHELVLRLENSRRARSKQRVAEARGVEQEVAG